MVISRKIPPEALMYEMGGLRVTANDVKQVRRADLTALDRPAHAGKTGVEAPVESDLQLDPGLFHRCQGLIDLFQSKGDRLLAENVFAFAGRCHHKIRVRIGRRTNQHRLDRGVRKDVLSAPGYSRDTAARGHLHCRWAVDVRDDQRHGVGQSEREGLSVNAPDPPRSDDSD
jgi:hypothetical protein